MMFMGDSHPRASTRALPSCALFVLVAFACLWSQASAGPLLDTIQDIPDLSAFNSLVRGSSNLTTLLNLATDFTLLAPSNDAIYAWREKKGSQSDEVVEATIRYHLLKGRFTTVQFSDTPLFVHSWLDGKTFANVSNGQVVELSKRGGKPVVVSGNGTVSGIITPENRISTGGFVQVIDTVLDIPRNLVTSISDFNLNHFAAVLNAGNFVNQEDSPVIKQVLRASDMTFFAPNTQQALNDMTAQARNTNKLQQLAIFSYHVIPSAVYSSDLKDGMKIKTIQGGELTVTIIGGDIYINQAKILTSNLLIANGVMHTLDNLLDTQKTEGPQKPTIVEPPPKEVEKPKASGLSTGAKAGIGVGITTIVLIAVAVFVFLRGRRKLRQEAEDNDKQMNDHKSRDRGFQDAPLHPPPPRSAADIELEANHSQNSLAPLQKKWENDVHAVEIDGVERR